MILLMCYPIKIEKQDVNTPANSHCHIANETCMIDQQLDAHLIKVLKG